MESRLLAACCRTDVDANCLAGGATSGARIEWTGRLPPQCFRQKLLIRGGQGAGADIGRALSALVRSLVVAKSSLHVDAIDGIVDAVLNIPEVAHDFSVNCLDMHSRKTP
jgi:hypothetical protein